MNPSKATEPVTDVDDDGLRAVDRAGKLIDADATNNPPELQATVLREAWRAVANAKLVEYRRQCWRLAILERQGLIAKPDAIDRLFEIAIAHALVRALGEDRIEAIVAEAFA